MAEQPEIRKDQIEHMGKALAEGCTLYLDAGFSPSEVATALAAATYAVMKSVGMSRMAISNALHEMADGVRDQAFADNEKTRVSH